MTISSFTRDDLPVWREVRAAIDRYDEARLRATLYDVINARGDEIDAVVKRSITSTVGSWYGCARWSVESDPFDLYDQQSLAERLDRTVTSNAARSEVVAWIVTQVGAMISLLREVGAVIEGVDVRAQGDAREAALRDAVERVVELMRSRVGYRVPWSPYAGDATLWLGDVVGVARSAATPKVEHAVDAFFNTWDSLTPVQREAVLRSLLDALSPAPRELPGALVTRVDRLLSPRRTRFAEAVAVVKGVKHAEAAEALVARGFLDESWLDPSRHAFTGFNREARLRPPRAKPNDSFVYALLASDPEGVARAEALATEFAHRLRAYGLRDAPTRLVWALDRDTGRLVRSRFLLRHETLDRIVETAERLSNATDLQRDLNVWADAVLPALPLVRDPRDLRARCIDAAVEVSLAVNARTDRIASDAATITRYWSASRWWSMLADAGALVPGRVTREALGMWEPASLTGLVPDGTPLRDLPDPLSALVALWDTGYTLHSIDPNENALVLLLPAP